MDAWSGEGRGWSLRVKQLWKDTSTDSPLGTQVGDREGVCAFKLGRGGGLRWLGLTLLVVTAEWRPPPPRGLALTESYHYRAGAPSRNLASGSRAGGMVAALSAEQANSCLH